MRMGFMQVTKTCGCDSFMFHAQSFLRPASQQQGNRFSPFGRIMVLITSSNTNEETFIFTFTPGSDQGHKTLHLKINVAEHIDVDELFARVMKFHNIPCFVERDFKDSLKSFIECKKNRFLDEHASKLLRQMKDNPSSIDKIAKSVGEKYKKTWAKYSSSEDQNEDEHFSSMYHKLIHSQAMIILLPLEQHYAREVRKVLNDKEQSLVKLHERHELEMQRACDHVGDMYTEAYINELTMKHVEASERLEKHWKDHYTSLVESQKREFRDVIVKLHVEMMANKGIVDEHGHMFNVVKKIIEASANSVDMYSQSSDVNMFGPSDSTALDSPNKIAGTNFSPEMEESFTINLGAQMKTMHNIRLVMAPLQYFCQHSSQSGDAEAQRLQTVMSLYSSSLSGLIILVDADIETKRGVNPEFVAACKASTEFHFLSLSEQLKQTKKHSREVLCSSPSIDHLSVKSADSASSDSSNNDSTSVGNNFQEGDFIVTKHSNLSKVHVVFHLCSIQKDICSRESTTMTSRHPVIMGMRHILKVMSSYDVGTLTVPLLLTYKLNEGIDEAWILKRAELIMKCMKGYMMEMATWDGGLSHTMQFVVPPGISDLTFDKLVAMLPEIFRTTSARVLTTSGRKKNIAASNSPKNIGRKNA